jgi:(2Fe-2S) ferredoxin
MRYEKHIFICCNDKDPGKKSCGSVHGMELITEFRELIAELPNKNKLRVQKSGCLDACGKGPTLVIYPEGNYYGNVQKEDIKELFESEILNNKPLERLKINFE